MSVVLSNDAGLPLLVAEEEFEAALDEVLRTVGLDVDAVVSVAYVDDDAMRELNHAWRGIDAPTDVLSFPLLDGSCPEEVLAHARDTEEAPVELGDIVLAPAVIEAQAPAFGTTSAEECRLMLVHGMLHLLGYDHMNEEDALAMEERELTVLRALATRRGEDPATVRIGPVTRHHEDERGE